MIEDIMPQEPIPEVYLGDGVNASFDGYQIWLKTCDGNNQQIALESSVYRALKDYAARVWGQS